jgi:hypothetical protein
MEALNDKALIGEVLVGHGGDRRSENAKADQVDNINLKTKGGTSRAYILARLDRDGHIELKNRDRGFFSPRSLGKPLEMGRCDHHLAEGRLDGRLVG